MGGFKNHFKNSESHDQQVVEINKINLDKVEAESHEKKQGKEAISLSKDRNFIKRSSGTSYFKILALFLIVFLGVFPVLIFFLILKPLIKETQSLQTRAKLAYTALKDQDLMAAETSLKDIQENLEKVKKIYGRLNWLKFIPLLNNYWHDGSNILTAAESGIAAGQTLIETLNPYADILGFKGKGSFTGGTAEDRIVKIIETLPKILPKVDEIAENLKKADGALNQVEVKRYPEKIKNLEIKAKLVKMKELVHDGVLATTDLKPILEILPTALGYPEMRRYLIIFQNDGELRPTGGFMTAYGVLRVDKGRVRAEKSDDIYTLDKKFNSRLKPPEPIAKYLLSADLKSGIVPYFYLRDMNFSPDFKTSMEIFFPNYQKVKDEPEVEGVITVDTKVLTDLLGVLGPLEVPGYGKFTLESDKRCFEIPQIICELEYLADMPIAGVKLARKDILGPMMQELILKAMGSPKNIWPKLFETLMKNIEEKHILFYFVDEKVQKAAEIFNAAGRIKDYDGDYLHVNDANLGGAKSNLFVKETIEKELTKDDKGRWLSTLTITYQNPVPMSDCNLERKSGLCLNGILRNYVRIYVPRGSKLVEGLGSEEKFQTGEEFGKTYFSGFFTLRGGGGRAKIVLRYELPPEINLEKEYKFLIQKQPGTLGHQVKIKVNHQEETFELKKDREIIFKFN